MITALLIVLFGIALMTKQRTGGTTAAGGDPVRTIAQAIAKAEGFYAGDTLPFRHNNPGDILDASGQNIQYPTVEDGWNALYHQVSLILTDKSHVYKSDMSIAQIAGLYTGGDNPGQWAQTVAQHLGLSISDPLTAVQA